MSELEGVKQTATAINASAKEVEAAFSGPAVSCNKVLITLSPHTGRLSFVELQPGDAAPHYRAAVSMGITDLVALRDLLNRMLPDENLETITLRAPTDANTK